MNNKVIFWDFDGVIADTFEQCFAVSRLAYPDMTELEYRQRFEGNINKAKHRTEPVREIDFFAEFEKTIFDAPLIDGIADVIKDLSQDYSNVIISSTISHLIDRYLTQHGLRQYFEEIMGNDVAHSKVEKFKLAFQNHQTSNSHAVLITDTLGDILEANEVNLSAIGVAWGFQTRATLQKGNPKSIIENAHELIGEVNELLTKNGRFVRESL